MNAPARLARGQHAAADAADRRRRVLGRRIAEARRDSGLSQRELGERLGISLWDVELLERGDADAAVVGAGDLATATGKPAAWFAPQLIKTRVEVGADDRPAYPPRATLGRHVVLATLVLLVVIRFFTEVFQILPGFLNFLDIPLLAVVAFAALLFPAQGRVPYGALRLGLPVLLFLGVCLASTLANPNRIDIAPVIVFLYGFLGPLGFGYLAYRLWPVGNARVLSRTLFVLALIQFVVVIVVDLPRFVASGGGPDQISGTFGLNAYQLVFFLIVVVALCTGMATFERGTLAARVAPLVVVGSFFVIFLAQYRALLVSTLVSLLVLGVMLATARGLRGFFVTVFTIACFAAALIVVADRFPSNKFSQTIGAFSSDPAYFAGTRFNAFGDIASVYVEHPQSMLVGTGPGTYSSRAWRTFADISGGQGEVTTPYIRGFTGGAKYRTDVSEKYVIPRLVDSEAVLGSRALTSPYSSYVSLLAEVGMLGFFVMIGIYVAAASRSMRMALAAMRRPRARDPLPGLLLASTIGLVLLLQMALLENWLEVMRVTVPIWILFAVATKEFRARAAADREDE